MPVDYCFAIVLGSDVSFACGVVPIQKHRILSQSNVLTLGKEALREMKAAVEFANVASDKVGTFKDGHDTLLMRRGNIYWRKRAISMPGRGGLMKIDGQGVQVRVK
jgi:hypothetical protein